MIQDNNPSLIIFLVVIVIMGLAVYFIASHFLDKKRVEDIEEISEMIKDRHSKIVNYQIKKEREDAALEETSSVDDVWSN